MLDTNKTTSFTISNCINILMAGLFCFLIYDAVVSSKLNQEYKFDYASLNHIEFGMLSIQEWKERLANILVKKINEFELNDNNRTQIKRMIIQGLNSAFDQVEKHLEKQTNSGGAVNVLVKKSIRKLIEGVYTDIDDFRSQIPQFANDIMLDLDNEGNQKDIKQFLKTKLMQFLDETIKDESYARIDNLLIKYDSANRVDCSSKLKQNIDIKNETIRSRLSLAIGLFLLIALSCFYFKNTYNNVIYILISALLLLGGVSLPMIDIDARIEKFYFLLMGEPLEFTNQIIFFQSKSILDVVFLLIKNGSFDSILVGFLILLFSIIFPVSKLLSSFWYMLAPAIERNKIVHFLIFKSAKWSMADVFVVAIFMAYIGFNSILKNQMDQVNRMDENLEVLSLQNTSFQMGFLLFILFTIASLFMSILIKNRNQIDKSNH